MEFHTLYRINLVEDNILSMCQLVQKIGSWIIFQILLKDVKIYFDMV